MKQIAIFLCDITGKMAEPWVDAGYDVVLVDPQHPAGIHTDGQITRVGDIIIGCANYLGQLLRTGRIVFVMGFPPCTDVAVSGSRWFEVKRAKDPHFQAKAALVAEQCRMVGLLSGGVWAFENPVSVFSSIFGKPSYTFSPNQFTGHCANDNYTKKTCLWTSEDFEMPENFKDTTLGEPGDRIHKCPPGPERANIRSATPSGFAMAVFLANAPHLREVTNDNQRIALATPVD